MVFFEPASIILFFLRGEIFGLYSIGGRTFTRCAPLQACLPFGKCELRRMIALNDLLKSFFCFQMLCQLRQVSIIKTPFLYFPYLKLYLCWNTTKGILPIFLKCLTPVGIKYKVCVRYFWE